MDRLLDRDAHVARAETVTEEHPSPLARVGQVIILVAGAIMLLSGVLGLARADLDGDLTSPVVEVFGFAHAPWLAIAEVAVGLLLVASGATAWARGGAVVLGTLLVVIGAVLLIDEGVAPDEWALDGDYGWFLVVAGGAAAIGGLLPGGWVRSKTDRVE
jgi:hypothetical protein